MYVEKIKLYNFRNYTDFSATFSDKINFIIGNNAQGKTNLIEAVNLISTTKSFRTSQVKDLIQWNKHEMSVLLTLHGNLNDQDLCFSVSKTGRQVYVNGEKVGYTTSGTKCPYFDYPIAMARIPREYKEIGTPVQVDVRGRMVDAEVIELPFYKR